MVNRKVPGHLSEDIYRITNTESQKFKYSSPYMSVVSTVVNSQSSLTKAADLKKAKNWRKDISIRDEYADYCDEFVNMLKSYASMFDGHLQRISTVKKGIYLESPTIRSVHSVPYRD